MAGKTGCALDWGGFDKALGRAAQKMKNRKEMMDSVGEALVSGTIRRFADEEGPDGEKWKPSRRALAQGGQTLVDTGRLRNSIDYAATPDKVMVGTNLPYALIHQKGGTITPKTRKHLKFKGANGWATVDKVSIPPRPFIGISNEDMEEAKATVAAFMAGAFAPAVGPHGGLTGRNGQSKG